MKDRQTREEAATARTNVVVTAGAGTGKTTLLVDTVLRRILDDGVDVRRLLMLTFTEKAANEMRIRLEEELRRHPDRERAAPALQWLDRAQISTIHGFCAHLLREFPVEAGVDPRFVVDEGTHAQEIFDREWDRWLRSELGEGAPRRAEWLRILTAAGLSDVREVAERLCDFHVPEGALDREAARARGREELERIRGEVAGELETLVTPCSRPANNLLGQMNALARYLKEGGDSDFLEKKQSEDRRGWLPEDYEAASRATSDALMLAKDIAALDEEAVGTALERLAEFARGFRATYAAEGFVSFDGLLTLAHDLLSSETFPSIRARVRERFDFILVDEFQDTDPVQCRIVLRLAEDDRGALMPGRLFIVGDPKQSIYSFRGADIVAYERVKKRMMEEGARTFVLRTNFRSHAGLLDVVNGMFSQIIRPLRELQPEYEAIDAAPGRPRPPEPSVELILFDKEQGKITSEESRRGEAEAVAGWIAANVKHRKDVAILLKALTDVHVYLEALRDHGVPYVVEGEKFFYGTSEVVDVVNLLRVVADPNDGIALLGVLRSPLGAVDDRALVALKEREALDYRRDPGDARIRGLYERLRALHARSRQVPVAELVEEIFETMFVQELAAAAYAGEQALANVRKIRDKARELGTAGLGVFLKVVNRSIRELSEEGESPLADETLDAVRVMSVHKSKGLEFPVVILPDLHREMGGRREEPAVRYDWSSQTLGIRLGDRVDAGAAALAYHEMQRRREEAKRLPYVAMTRPRERLIMLGRAHFSSSSLLGMMERAIVAAGGPSLVTAKGEIAFAGAKIALRHEMWRESPRRERPAPVVEPADEDWKALAALWRRREDEYRESLAAPRFTSPSRLQDKARPLAPDEAERMEHLATVGTLCHRALENMDFRKPEVSVEGGGPEGAEARAILKSFLKTAAFQELAKAEIVARELPFVMKRGGTVLNGAIDVVYRLGRKLWVGDYKSDREEHPEQYGEQKKAYLEAVARILGEKPAGFKLIYLRSGRLVEA